MPGGWIAPPKIHLSPTRHRRIPIGAETDAATPGHSAAARLGDGADTAAAANPGRSSAALDDLSAYHHPFFRSSAQHHHQHSASAAEAAAETRSLMALARHNVRMKGLRQQQRQQSPSPSPIPVDTESSSEVAPPAHKRRLMQQQRQEGKQPPQQPSAKRIPLPQTPSVEQQRKSQEHARFIRELAESVEAPFTAL